MHLHAEPIVTIIGRPVMWHLRVYDVPGGFEARRPYLAICTVTILGTTAEISGLHGTFDRATWRMIESWLRQQGAETALMERRGRYRLRR